VSTIKCHCTQCGAVYVPASEVYVIVTQFGPTYQFTCGCEAVIVRACSPSIVALLVAHGCPSNRPGELDEPHDGPALEPDDLITFVLGMDAPDWFNELLTIDP
jgi:hypothetical protein